MRSTFSANSCIFTYIILYFKKHTLELFFFSLTFMLCTQSVTNFTNYEEWMADTNPTNGASFFHILAWNVLTNIVFVSSTNRQFCIEYRSDLTDTGERWSIDGDWFIGDDTQTEMNVSTNAEKRFYRVKVKLR